MSLPGKMKSGVTAVIDIGTTKVACFIAELNAAGEPTILGIGHHVAKGMRSGSIIDIGEVENAVCAAVQSAEQMAGTTIEDAVVSVTGGRPYSRRVTVESGVSRQGVTPQDISELLARARHIGKSEDREILHSIPISFTLDQSGGIKDPVGMFGQRIAADVHLISVHAGFLRNFTQCLARCQLNVRAFVVSSYADGKACLEPDEMDLGVTLIDMGGGVTSVSVFRDGAIAYTDSVSIGGGHVTSDIAKGLSTSLQHAERIKTLYGCAIASPADEHEVIDVPQIGEERAGEVNHIPRSMLVRIIRPRLEETFEMIRGQLEASGMDGVAGRRVVLTGGGSQLLGMRELASQVLGKQVRLGKPRDVPGLAEATGSAGFSTVVGLLSFAGKVERELRAPAQIAVPAGSGKVSRALRWLRENF